LADIVVVQISGFVFTRLMEPKHHLQQTGDLLLDQPQDQRSPAAIILIQMAPYPSTGKPSLLKSRMVNQFYVGQLLLNKTLKTLWCNIV